MRSPFQRRSRLAVLTWLLVLALASAAHAEIQWILLGTAPPPLELGGIPVATFDVEEQEAIPDYEVVRVIPGSPIPGDMSSWPGVQKLTVPATWPSWSHGYRGPVFVIPWFRPPTLQDAREGIPLGMRLTLPPGATAVYVYVGLEQAAVVEVTANDAITTPPILITEPEGFGFYTTQAGEIITTLVVSAFDEDNYVAIAEFGISDTPVPVELYDFRIDP